MFDKVTDKISWLLFYGSRCIQNFLKPKLTQKIKVAYSHSSPAIHSKTLQNAVTKLKEEDEEEEEETE